VEVVILAFVPAISDPHGANHNPVSDTVFNNRTV